MWSELRSSSGRNERTGVVSIRRIALVIGEEDVACGDAIEIIADSEVKPEGPLHVESLETGDRQAKGSGDPVGDVIERIEIIERRQQWTISEKLGGRLAIRDIDIVNLVFLEGLEDFLCRIECCVACGTVGQNSDPNRGTGGSRLWGVFPILLYPAEANEVDRAKLDLLTFKEFDDLGRNISSPISTLREGHVPF